MNALGTQQGADGETQSVTVPVDLRSLVADWPTMPEHIKAAIMALVATVKKK